MNTKSLIKLIVFNLIIVIVDIILFSNGFVGLSLSSPSLVKKILFFVVLAISVILLIFINATILNGQNKIKVVDKDELKKPKDYIDNLKNYYHKKEFTDEIKVLIGQINRISPKTSALDTILLENFEPQEMTYIKFKNMIDDVSSIFFDNVKKTINRIAIFDDLEYENLINNKIELPDNNKEEKISIYQKHISYVNGLIQKNEEIITKFDNLMLEISQLDDVNEQSVENIQILNEFDELINNTKYYN